MKHRRRHPTAMTGPHCATCAAPLTQTQPVAGVLTLIAAHGPTRTSTSPPT